MHVLVTIIHVLVCFILVAVVLLQAGKGAEMGAAFGGSSQTLFGSRGGATFLSKLTIGAAVFYMLTSLTLTVLKKEQSVVPSVADRPDKGAPITGKTATDTKPAGLPPVSRSSESKQDGVTAPEDQTESPTLGSPTPETPKEITPAVPPPPSGSQQQPVAP